MNSTSLLRLRRALLALAVATSIACGSPTPSSDAGDAAVADSSADSTLTDATRRDDVAADQSALEDRPALDAPASDVALDTPTPDVSLDAPATDVAASPDGSSSTDVTSSRDAASDASTLDGATVSDAARDALADSSAPCAIAGDWAGTVSMAGMVQFRFRSDGTWLGAPAGTSLDGASAIALGNYSTATGTLVLTNEPGLSGCMMGDRGEYRLTYDATCGTMTWMVVSDTCASRAAVLSGATFRRIVADGGAADAGPSDATVGDAGACRMIGDWSTMVPGGSLWFRFIADGTWEAALSLMQLTSGPRIALGNQSETPPRIVLTNDPSMVSGCAMSDRGEYTITYTPGCGSARWTLVTDTCSGRAAALNGATLTRL